MKKIFLSSIRTNNKKNIDKYIVLIILLGVLIASCSTNNEQIKQNNSGSNIGYSTKNTIESNTQIPTVIVPSFTPSPTEKTENIFDMEVTIDFNQGSIHVLTVNTPDNQHLYRNAKVTFNLGQYPNTRSYINLDDLNNNGFNNSDILLMASTGTMTTYYLYTANNAEYYFSENKQMDYSSCVKHFPLSGFVASTYHHQSFEITTEGSYCILTNEGRMAVVSLIQDSTIPNDEYKVNPTLVVTVYKQIVTNAYSPMPTETPGPSPTANRYSGTNFTITDIKILDSAGQDFLNAVANKDKKALSEMLVFPVYITFNGDSFQVYDNEEFFKIYDQLFSAGFTKELSKAIINENMRNYNGGISLSGNDYRVSFTRDGKILEIAYFGK